MNWLKAMPGKRLELLRFCKRRILSLSYPLWRGAKKGRNTTHQHQTAPRQYRITATPFATPSSMVWPLLDRAVDPVTAPLYRAQRDVLSAPWPGDGR